MDEFLRTLDDGRVFVDYGPVSMVITARREGEPLSELARAAFPLIRDSPAEIAGELDTLRRYPSEGDFSHLTGLPRVMAEAVLATGEPTLTPMAAVAGTMADMVADKRAFWAELEIDNERLTIPHPQVESRPFVKELLDMLPR